MGGRKTGGVWYGDGADDGGLKTMWSFTWDGGIEEVNDGSGFVLRRLVVRRAEDSFLRDTQGTKRENEGRRKCRLAGGRMERDIDMLSLWNTDSSPGSHEQFDRSDLFWARALRS